MGARGRGPTRQWRNETFVAREGAEGRAGRQNTRLGLPPFALADDRFVQFRQAVNVCLHRELEAGGRDATAELDHVQRR
jgi:hypothetical protein